MEFPLVTLGPSFIINISKNPNYTYLIPQLQIELGKKDRTWFPNLTEVAYVLDIHPKYIIIYLGLYYKYSIHKEPYYIVGHRSVKELTERMDKFIKGLILCRKCNGVGLKLNVDRKLYLECKNCGVKYRALVEEKFENFVVKNNYHII